MLVSHTKKKPIESYPQLLNESQISVGNFGRFLFNLLNFLLVVRDDEGQGFALLLA